MNKPYHPANVAASPYASWRLIALAWVANALGIQFKIDGIPYGAPYRAELWADGALIGDGLNDAF